MKRILLLLTWATLPIWHGSGQLLAGDECRLIDWDTVTGGSHITPSIEIPGICKYEVRTDNLYRPVLLQTGFTSSFEASLSHEIHFDFAANLLNNDRKGHFSIMSLDVAGTIDPLFALELSWSNVRQSKDVLFLEGKVSPELLVNPWRTSPPQPGAGPVAIHDGFNGTIQVTVRFIESSGPGLDDGVIEVWVDGILEASWADLALDWSISDAPVSVSYGVLKILERQTSGALRMSHLQPGPANRHF